MSKPITLDDASKALIGQLIMNPDTAHLRHDIGLGKRTILLNKSVEFEKMRRFPCQWKINLVTFYIDTTMCVDTRTELLTLSWKHSRQVQRVAKNLLAKEKDTLKQLEIETLNDRLKIALKKSGYQNVE